MPRVPTSAKAPKTGTPAKKKARKPGRRPPRSKLKPAEIDALFEALALERPVPRGELNYVNAYTLLVAVVLSAQATDVGVNRATGPLFARVDNPADMVALGEERLAEAIKTIGLYRNKARHVIQLSQRLLDAFGAEVPADRTALETLPGVGRKTANVVLNIAFGEPTIAVDTHIFRVANRTGIAPGKDPLMVELGLEKSVPDRFKRHAHHWLILHGRYVCKARKPDCPACPIVKFCHYKDKVGV